MKFWQLVRVARDKAWDDFTSTYNATDNGDLAETAMQESWEDSCLGMALRTDFPDEFWAMARLTVYEASCLLRTVPIEESAL